MAKYNAIARVSDALIETLQQSMTGREDVISLDRSEIVLSSPDDVGSDSDVRLSLYLFKVAPSDHQQTSRVTHNDMREAAPLALDLNYLLTAYPSTSGTNESTNMRDQHNALGLAMQVFHDNSLLSQAELGAGFDDDTQLTVSMDSDSESSVSRIWDSFQNVPRYPSVTYTVGPVHIDSRRKEEITRVQEREVRADQKDV